MPFAQFLTEMKQSALEQLQQASPTADRLETHYDFKSGHADITILRGGAIAKAVITEMVVKGVDLNVDPEADMGVAFAQKPQDDATARVYQMEIFPANPYCPMGHFNLEWSAQETGTYFMNLDLFPAVRVQEDLDRMKDAMDQVADQFGLERNAMRAGLDVQYNMAHWPHPLAAMVGCKMMGVPADNIDRLITAYRTFFDTYMHIFKSRKDTPFTPADDKLAQVRNGRWLEYVTLKDSAIQIALESGIPSQVLMGLAFPPSAAFVD